MSRSVFLLVVIVCTVSCMNMIAQMAAVVVGYGANRVLMWVQSLGSVRMVKSSCLVGVRV